MNKTELKKVVKNFALNCALATAMFSLLLIYLPLVLSGEVMVWLLVANILCFIGDVCFATRDWKKFKKLLGESE